MIEGESRVFDFVILVFGFLVVVVVTMTAELLSGVFLAFLEFFSLDDYFLDDEWSDLIDIDVVWMVGSLTALVVHRFREDDQEHPAVSEVACHFLDLDLVEDKRAMLEFFLRESF